MAALKVSFEKISRQKQKKNNKKNHTHTHNKTKKLDSDTTN